MHVDDVLAKLGRAARKEPAPEVDVTEAVLRRVRTGSAPSMGALAIVAGVSAAAAAVVVAFALQAWWEWQDPFAQMFLGANLVIE